MKQIKSKNAKAYILEKMPRKWVADAVQIANLAEDELSEKNEDQMQQLRDKVVEAHKQHCTNSRCRAYGNWKNQTCMGNCEYMKSFMNEL